MDKHHDLSLLDLKDHFEIVDPNTLELPAEQPQPAADHNEPAKPKPTLLSIEQHGLLEAPLVAGKKVIDGAHRVRAAIELGRQFILIRQVGTIVDPAIILSHSYLVRRPVTVLREAEMLAGLKLEYEQLHPETTKGGDAKTKKAKKEQSGISSFCRYVAALTGRDPRTIQSLVKIASLDADARVAIHKDEEFANRQDKLYSLLQCGKGDAKDVTQLEVVEEWQANGKKKAQGKIPDGDDNNGRYTFFDCVNAVVRRKQMGDPKLKDVPLTSKDYTILHGDFRDRMKEVPDGSIDAIVTDPPYLAPYLYLLPAFIKEAARVLKPNGFAAIMYGNMFLDAIMHELRRKDPITKKRMFHFRCIIADVYGGKGQTHYGVGISNKWKSVLVYGKKTLKLPTFGADLIRRPTDPQTGKPTKSGKEKHWFQWQQPLFVFERLVKLLTKPGETVLDPFLGSGTTMIAALKNNRKCIGVELEKKRIDYTKYRLLYELDLKDDPKEEPSAAGAATPKAIS